MNAKQRAIELYNQHIELAATDGRLFRKTVMDTLMLELGISLASAATHYNTAKKAAPVEGLGRPTIAKAVRKAGAGKDKATDELQEDNDCFTVIELLKHEDCVTVGRCRSHLMQGDASEEFDERIEYKPSNEWVMIQGLGPLHGETYKLSDGEKEIKRYTPAVISIVAKEAPILIDEEDEEEDYA